MTRRISFVCGAALIVALSGCASLSGILDKAGAPPKPASDPAAVQLAMAADRASKSLAELAMIENRRNPPASVASIDLKSLPPELSQAVTMTWVGPIGPFVRVLADMAGWTFQEVGPKSGVAVLVKVDAKDRPLLEVLRDVGMQAVNRATVRCDAATRTIEVRYAPAT